ncbi:ABC transporter ATP-binding protein [Enterococcus avium]|uniref:ABC transporter ATP-binding protein n=1 Tax=Enterococcus avium TaxID=33945 RepID=UPI00288E7BCE|nr:ABC transporter ATP-binding protein [Enterococcus avium]MDT2477456.1 ABC transporter ATP-binding protein [Enterococcus avium]
MSSEIQVNVRNLKVSYGKNVAVRDISFELKKGEILAIIGPNGSGKTSTVECIEGLRKPTYGQVSVFGMNPQTQRKQIYKHLGVQLQETQYPDKIRVQELCELFSSFYEKSADWEVLLTKLGLEDKRNRDVSKLSGGEKQKLSILLALLPKPRLLILDELTTGLDPEARRSLWNSIRAVKEAGISVLLISHFMDEVEYLSDRILFLKKGEIFFIGTSLEMKNTAVNTCHFSDHGDNISLEDVYIAMVGKQGELDLEVLS